MGTKKTSESLFIEAKACHYELLHILEAETERASEELRGISAWIEEIRRAAKRVTGPEDRVRLEDDLRDLSGYETEILHWLFLSQLLRCGEVRNGMPLLR